MVTRPVMAIIATLIRLNWRTVVAVTYGRVHWNSVTMSTIGEFRCGVRVVVLHNPTLPDNGPPYPCFGEGIVKTKEFSSARDVIRSVCREICLSFSRTW